MHLNQYEIYEYTLNQSNGISIFCMFLLAFKKNTIMLDFRVYELNLKQKPAIQNFWRYTDLLSIAYHCSSMPWLF